MTEKEKIRLEKQYIKEELEEELYQHKRENPLDKLTAGQAIVTVTIMVAPIIYCVHKLL